MEGLDIISENIDSSIETKIELINQEDCKHDWIKGRGDYNINVLFVYFTLVMKIYLHVVNVQSKHVLHV